MGYDGSRASAAAIDVAALLFPGVQATIAYRWAPPFGDAQLRERISPRAKSVDELIALVKREGGAQAERLAADGTALARAAGWSAEPSLAQNARLALHWPRIPAAAGRGARGGISAG